MTGVSGNSPMIRACLCWLATQAENVDWATLELGDRSLFDLCADAKQAAGQSFDLKQWLSLAEKQVPELYRRFVKEKQQATEKQQEPVLFDSSKNILLKLTLARLKPQTDKKFLRALRLA